MNYRLLFILLFFPAVLNAQVQKERDVIAAAGNSFSSVNLQVAHTVGETIVTGHSTVNLELSQGFHQYVEMPNSIAEQDIVQKFSLYPNPVSDELTITFSAEERSNWRFTVTNLLGEVVAKSKVSLADRKQARLDLNCRAYPEGAYFVRLTDSKTGKSVSRKFLKIK